MKCTRVRESANQIQNEPGRSQGRSTYEAGRLANRDRPPKERNRSEQPRQPREQGSKGSRAAGQPGQPGELKRRTAGRCPILTVTITITLTLIVLITTIRMLIISILVIIIISIIITTNTITGVRPTLSRPAWTLKVPVPFERSLKSWPADPSSCFCYRQFPRFATLWLAQDP